MTLWVCLVYVNSSATTAYADSVLRTNTFIHIFYFSIFLILQYDTVYFVWNISLFIARVNPHTEFNDHGYFCMEWVST